MNVVDLRQNAFDSRFVAGDVLGGIALRIVDGEIQFSLCSLDCSDVTIVVDQPIR